MEIQNGNGNRWMTNKIRRNVSLDQDTIDIIEAYSLKNNGEKNLSSGIRTMARSIQKQDISILLQSARVAVCIKCNSADIEETGIALTSMPAQYQMRCNSCGNIFYK